MKKAVRIVIISVVALLIGYFAFIYYVPYSTGVRTGELIKISHKGVGVKTWEGEISQGVSGAKIFSFSIEDSEKEVIELMQKYQGQYVKLEYKERFKTFFWLGDTRYFITSVVEEKSPHSNR